MYDKVNVHKLRVTDRKQKVRILFSKRLLLKLKVTILTYFFFFSLYSFQRVISKSRKLKRCRYED